MKNEPLEEHLSPEIDQTLQSTLSDWAARHRPSPHKLEAVRQSVLAQVDYECTDLPYEWWQAFFARLNAQIAHATDVRRILPTSCTRQPALRT